MQKIYPAGTRSALEVFQIYEGQGNFFDIRDPSHIQRGSFSFGEEEKKTGYLVRTKKNKIKNITLEEKKEEIPAPIEKEIEENESFSFVV